MENRRVAGGTDEVRMRVLGLRIWEIYQFTFGEERNGGGRQKLYGWGEPIFYLLLGPENKYLIGEKNSTIKHWWEKKHRNYTYLFIF
jgi:hypothetical protein